MNVKETTPDHHIFLKFKISGEVKILLRFTGEQLDQLFSNNPETLGAMVGRILQELDHEEPFPENLQKLIITHPHHEGFNQHLFVAFTSGVRSFMGNKYDQAYAADYRRLAKWSDDAVDSTFREWISKLRVYLYSDAERSKEIWQEREVA